MMGVTQAPFFPVTCGGMVCNWFPISGWGMPGAISNASCAGTTPLNPGLPLNKRLKLAVHADW